METKLKPTCAVVGMGPGVSLAVARRFGMAGYRIAMVARRKEKLAEFTGQLGRAGISASGFEGDCGDETSLNKSFEEIKAQMGTPEVLVYNASLGHQANPSALPAAKLLEDFRVNVVGALVATQAVVEPMKAAKQGTILFTGGGLAFEPYVSAASLAIGKSGIRSLAFSLHKELTPFHIHVATVTICGYVQEGTRFSPDKIAETYFQLHQQPEGQWERETVFK
jgi:short-subunit dehydrogenase